LALHIFLDFHPANFLCIQFCFCLQFWILHWYPKSYMPKCN
jgi:hypothetical protein